MELRRQQRDLCSSMRRLRDAKAAQNQPNYPLDIGVAARSWMGCQCKFPFATHLSIHYGTSVVLGKPIASTSKAEMVWFPTGEQFHCTIPALVSPRHRVREARLLGAPPSDNGHKALCL